MDKKGLNMLLLKWIKWDKRLWAKLTEIQIELLIRRLIEEMTYSELGVKYQTPPKRIKKILLGIFHKVKESHGQELAALLDHVNDQVEFKEQGLSKRRNDGFDFKKVFLN